MAKFVKFTADEKEEWAKDKKSSMEVDVNKFLGSALESKDGIANLTNHYRVMIKKFKKTIILYYKCIYE